LPGPANDVPHPDIGAPGIMVGQKEAFDASLQGQLHRFFIGGVAPAPVGGHVLGEVLGVMNQQVRALGEFDKIREAVAAVQAEFVVGDEHQGLALLPEAEPQAPLGWFKGRESISASSNTREVRAILLMKLVWAFSCSKATGKKPSPMWSSKTRFKAWKARGQPSI